MAKPKPQKESLIAVLEALGLSENEAVLYVAMLELPRSTVKELGARAPFPRTMLYYVLNQLIRRGLVSVRDEKSKKSVYVAEDPERLYEILASRESEFKKTAERAREAIPKLKSAYRLSGKRPSVRVFEGLADYAKALDDVLHSGCDEVLTYQLLGEKHAGLDIRNLFEGKRKAKKITKKVLFHETKDALGELRVRGYDDFTQFRALKKCPAVDLTLYSGKLLYVSYYDQHEPTAILVEDQALYMMQKDMFEMLWAHAKDYTLYPVTKV